MIACQQSVVGKISILEKLKNRKIKMLDYTPCIEQRALPRVKHLFPAPVPAPVPVPAPAPVPVPLTKSSKKYKEIFCLCN